MLAMLASCSDRGVGTNVSPIEQQQLPQAAASIKEQNLALVRSFVSPAIEAPGGASLFVSDGYNQAVYIYNVAGTLTGTLTGFSLGGGNSGGLAENLAVDASGNLYIADRGNEVVDVYAPPYNGKPKVLGGVVSPQAVSVDRNGNVAVGTDGESGVGNVTFYAKGATSPTTIVGPPCMCRRLAQAYVDNVAFDGNGNLYFDAEYCLDDRGCGYFTSGEILGGIKAQSTLLLAGGGTGGVQVTTDGLIAFAAGPGIVAYNPPQNGNFGSPAQITPLSSPGSTFVFAKNDAVVFSAGGGDTVNEYAYPAGGSPIRTLYLPPNASALGIAVNPAQFP